MANVINATSTGNGGLVSTGDDSGILNIQTNETTAITVDASQNVGIGTSSPTNRLTVNGGSGSTPTIRLNGGTAADDNALISSKYNLVLGCNADGNISSRAITFVNSTTEYARINSSGNLLIGNTDQSFKLSVLESNDATPSAIRATNASFTGQNLLLDAGPAAGTGYNFITARANYNSAASTVFRVLGNGNVQNTNNSYGSLSDISLKENITDATPKLADLMQVKVRNYNLKSDPTHKQIGVIAQELEQVFPSMVEELPDRDADGNNLGETTKAVKYSVFVPMLVKAIQELKAINDTQAETINALTARIVALEQA